jgi:tRNA pseudouridine(38-40) synthase
MKLITQIPDVPDVVEAVNELLPPEIRVWRIVRVQNSFNARTCALLPSHRVLDFILSIYRSCDSRKYTYFFPSYLLIPPKPGSGLYETLQRQVVPLPGTQPTASASASPHTVHPFWTDSAPVSSKDDDLERKRRWHAGTEDIRRLREIAKKFEGTRNFHNFTVGREFSDRSTQRHLKKIEVRVFLQGGQGLITHDRLRTRLSMAARSGSASCFTARVSCFTRYPVVANSRFFAYLVVRSCVRRENAAASTLMALSPQRKMVSALVLCCRTCTPPQIIEEVRYAASF